MDKALYSDAYSEERFRELLVAWSHISKFRESGSIYVYHKGELLRRHEALLNRPDLVKEYFKGKPPILIDGETGYFQDIELVEKEFQRYEASVTEPTYWLCGIDQLLLGKSEAFFHYLRARQAKQPAISYVLFFAINFLHPTVSPILTYTSTFLQNTFLTVLPDQVASEYFLQYLLRLWNFDMNERLQKAILKETSRHFLPLKQAVRFVRDTSATDIGQILHHEMMDIKLKSVYDGLLPSEQSAMAKVVAGANDFSVDEQVSIDFLKHTQWLAAHNQRLQLTIPILAKYLASRQSSQRRLDLAGNRILLNGVPVDTLFSPSERAALQLLITRRGQIVKREAIGLAVWGDQWEESYSDWALDQLITRLRKKCLKLDLPKSTITTVKGKGFRYGQP